jgi:endoglycosylceramidase
MAGPSSARWAASLVAAVCALVLLAACDSGGAGHASRRVDGRSLGPIRTAGRWLVDPQGRVVVLHGFNVIRKTEPYFPPVFGPRDADFLASQGFNGARIGFIWAGAERRPGKLDRAYLARIAKLGTVLGDAGLRVLVDVHQDLYSEKYHGFGAPGWASIDDGCVETPGVAPSESACRPGYLQAFQHLWDNTKAPDGVGLQAHFRELWRRGAEALGGAENLVGYDLFNEPYAGSRWPCGLFSPCPGFEQQDLPRFYDRLAKSIRSVDASTPIWFEPVPQSAPTETALPSHVTDVSNVGFSFHFYDRSCGLAPEPASHDQASAQVSRCTPIEAAALDAGIAYSRRADVPVFLGEFGDSENRVDNALMVDLAGERFLSWTYWQYNTTGASVSPGLLLDDAKPGSEANARTERLDALVVPYPQAIAGTPERYHFDRDTRTMTLTYGTRPVTERPRCTAPTTISIPARVYPRGYRVEVSGARVVSARGAAWLQLRSLANAKEVRVTVSPATDSRTDVPRQARDTSGAARVDCPA